MAEWGSGYLLVCRDASNRLLRNLSPAEIGSLLHEWLEWHDSLQAEGRLRFCSPVEDDSRQVSSRLDRVACAREEQREPVVGYLLIDAGSLEEATGVERSCPGLNRGFAIEIYRPFER